MCHSARRRYEWRARPLAATSNHGIANRSRGTNRDRRGSSRKRGNGFYHFFCRSGLLLFEFRASLVKIPRDLDQYVSLTKKQAQDPNIQPLFDQPQNTENTSYAQGPTGCTYTRPPRRDKRNTRSRRLGIPDCMYFAQS